MKTITALIFASIIVFACSQKDDEKGDGYPGVFNLYFDLKKSDGTPFEQGEVFFSQQYETNGELYSFTEGWEVLNKTVNELLGQELYFGPCGEYMFGWEDGDEPDNGSQWVNKTYVYLKYMGTEVIDTIVLRDSTHYPKYRHYDLFLNGEEIEYTTAPNNIEWLISIAKEEF